MRHLVWLTLLLIFFWWCFTPQQIPELSDIQYAPVETGFSKVLPPIFEEVALARGISFEHRQNTGGLSSFVDTLGAGACVLDANDDGWMDIFLVGGSGTRRHFGKAAWWANESANRLFINRLGSFSNQTQSLKGEAEPLASMGCSVADLNLDDSVDILLFGEGGLGVYENRADGFVYRPLLEVDLDTIVTGAVLLDVNHDGQLDIYVTTLVKYRPGKNVFEQFSGFAGVDPAFQPGFYDASPNVLLVNQGDLGFVDQTKSYGVGNAQGRSLGAKATDLNADGWLDLIVVNDFGTPNRVFLNQQGSSFEDANETFQALALSGSRSVVNYSSGLLFLRGAGQHPAWLTGPMLDGPVYLDDSRQAGLGSSLMIAASTWGAVAADLNMDGYEDVVLANGQLQPDEDARLSTSGQPNGLLLGTATHKLVVTELTSTNQRDSSRGVVTSDFDNDGDLDILIANNNSRFLLYDNQSIGSSKHHWISIEVDVSEAELARVQLKLQVGTMPIKFIRADLGQGFLSQSDRRMYKVLPPGTSELDAEIIWANGDRTTATLEVDRIYRVSPHSGFTERIVTAPQSDLDFRGLKSSEHEQVAEILSISRNLAAIELFWPQATLAGKQSVLTHLAPMRDVITSRVLQLGLGMKEEKGVHLKAVRLGRDAELDESVDWLISLLGSNSEVSCSVAELFEHFFDEEEIAIRRKGLAIKPLLQLVVKNDQSAVCALNAIAAAENKRAIPLLHELVVSDAELEVKVAAVRALGLMRDTGSVSVLRKLIFKNEEPTLLAAITIALVRLGDSDVMEAVFSSTTVTQRLNLIIALANSKDAAVVGQLKLSQLTLALLDKVAGDDEARLLLGAIATIGDRQFLSFVENSSLKGGFELVRATAALQGYLPDAALDLSISELDELLVLEPSVRISSQLWIQLFEAGVKQPGLSERLLMMPGSELSEVMLYLGTKPGLDLDTWIDACAKASGAPISVAAAKQLLGRVEWSGESLTCLLYGKTVNNRRLIANRIMIRQLEKRHTELSAELSAELPIRLSKFDQFYAVAPQDLAPGLRSTYLSSVKQHDPEVLLNWLNDERSDRSLKLQVLSELARLDTVATQRGLRKVL